MACFIVVEYLCYEVCVCECVLHGVWWGRGVHGVYVMAVKCCVCVLHGVCDVCYACGVCVSILHGVCVVM